jgi:hypothetical protein
VPPQFTRHHSDASHASALAAHTGLVLDFVTGTRNTAPPATFPHTPMTPYLHAAVARAVQADSISTYALTCVTDACSRLSESLGELLAHGRRAADAALRAVLCGPAHPEALARVALLPPDARTLLEKRDGTMTPRGAWSTAVRDYRLRGVYALPNVSCGIFFTQLMARGDDPCVVDLGTTHDEFFYYEHNFQHMDGGTSGSQWYTAWWQALHESLLYPPVAQRAVVAAIGSLYTAYKAHLEMAVHDAGLGDAATRRMLGNSRESFLRQQCSDSGVMGYLPQETYHAGSPRQAAWDLAMSGPGTDVIDAGRDIAGSAELGTSIPQLAEGHMSAERLAQVYARLCAVMDDATLRDDITPIPVLLATLTVWHLSNQRHPILEMMLIGRHAASGLYFEPDSLESYWDENLRMTGSARPPGTARCTPLAVTRDGSTVAVTPCPVFRAIMDRLGTAREHGEAIIDLAFGFLHRYTLDDIGSLGAIRAELAWHFIAIALDAPTEAGRHFIGHISHHFWTVERFCEMAMQGNYAFYADQHYIGYDRSERPAI